MRQRSSSTTTTTAIAGSTATARRSCCSPRTKPTRSGSTASTTTSPLCQRRHQRLRRSRRRKTRSIRHKRHQSRGALSLRLSRPARRATLRLRLTDAAPSSGDPFDGDFDAMFRSSASTRPTSSTRTVIPETLSDDAQNVMRQAFAGLLWTKQFYHYDVQHWLEGDPAQPAAARRARATAATASGRTSTTTTSSRCPTNGNIPGTPPGTWRSTASPLALVDPDFAKEQLMLLLREWYMHPNGQLPAYEWAFGDVNPPVHAWAAWRVYKIDKKRARRRRPQVSRARLPQAAAQFHLVGESQRRRGPQRLPGRLSRARQHRRLRPQRAAADRRPHRAVRRHELDGHVLPEHAGDRAGTGAATIRPTKTSPASSSSISSTSPTP